MVAISLIIVWSLILGPFVVLATNNPGSIPTVIEAGSMVSEASYIIFKDDNGATCAKNGTSGRIDYRSDNASYVIQNSIDNLPTEGGVIHINNGVYTLENPIWIAKSASEGRVNVHVRSDGATLRCDFPANFNYDIFAVGLKIEYRNFIFGAINPIKCSVEGIVIDGNNHTGLDGISFYTAQSKIGSSYGNRITDCMVYNVDVGNQFGMNGRGISIFGLVDSIVARNHASACDVGFGIFGLSASNMLSRGNNVINNVADNNTQMGFYLNGDRGCSFIGNHALSNGVQVNNAYSSAGVYVGEGKVNDIDYVISSNIISGNGVGLSGGSSANSVVSNNIICRNLGYGLTPQRNILITGNHIYNNGQNASLSDALRSGIYQGALMSIQKYMIDGNWIYDDQSIPTQLYGVYDGYGGAYHVIQNNYFYSVNSTVIHVMNTGANMVIKNNYGYYTENSGATIISAGQTSRTVNHGLSITPTKIWVSGSTLDTAEVYVDIITATQFVIRVPSAVSTNCTVYWRAEK